MCLHQFSNSIPLAVAVVLMTVIISVMISNIYDSKVEVELARHGYAPMQIRCMSTQDEAVKAACLLNNFSVKVEQK